MKSIMRSVRSRSLLLLTAVAAAATPGLVQAQTACGLPRGTAFFGLTADNQVIEYVVTANAVGPANTVGTVVVRPPNNALGRDIDKSVVGIDFRPADANESNLYTVTDQGDIRVISPYSRTYNSFFNALQADPISNLAVPINGGLHTTMDFNPVVDAIRLLGSNDLNYAVVNSGGNLNAFAQQTSLKYAAGDVAAGADPNITTGAYDNNVAGATRTTLYMLDYARDTLVTIADRTATGSSNTGGGMLKTIGNVVDATGARINVSPGSAMDIMTTADGRNIAVGYTQNRMFCLDLSTVNANLPVGQTQNVTLVPLRRNPFGNTDFLPVNEKLIDIAVPTRAPVSADASVSHSRTGSTSTVARLGDSLNYTVIVRNNGPSISAGAVVNVGAVQSNVGTLEIAPTFVGGGANCSRSGVIGTVGQVTCQIPALLSGQQISMFFDAKTIRPGANPGAVTLTTTVNITPEVPDPNAGNNTSTRVVNLSF